MIRFSSDSRPLRRAMRFSMITTGIMLVGKITAYLLTGSAAIFSDAAESVVHVAATTMAAISLYYAAIPADPGHPYGHGKIAYFSAGFEGSLILLASIGVMFTGVKGLMFGTHLQQLGPGLLILSGLTVINLALALYLIRVGKANHSLIVEANGRHVMSDVITTAGVLAGMVIVWITGLSWLDPLIALGVGFSILLTAVRLIVRSFHGLMDLADPKITKTLRECLDAAYDEGLMQDYHQLRHRQSNESLYVELHLLFPGDWTMDQAHKNVSVIEGRIIECLPEHFVYVTSHLEPADHVAAHPEGEPQPGNPLQNA